MPGIINDLLSAFFPFRCHICQTGSDFGQVLCGECTLRLQKSIFAPYPVKDTCCDFPVYTLSSYDSFMADIVKVIKYRPSLKLLRILAQNCLKQKPVCEFLKPDDILVAVPMHHERQMQRGFNQAEEIAVSLASEAGCNHSPVLQRIRATRPQADCSEEERRNNLEDAFSLSQGLQFDKFRGRRIVLVDDVATTGSTLQNCANKLKVLRPKEIIALVISHSFRSSDC
jgi:ComF family protein